MNHPSAVRARWFFIFFLVSGFCSLVYEVVWLRLAMAAFGVTTPLVSIVLSMFMAGLALGSWGGGRLARGGAAGRAVRAMRLYALAELVIGLSGPVVPPALVWGRAALARMGGGSSWGSAGHYAAAAVLVGFALVPFCAAMGATFPLAMGALRGAGRSTGQGSFGRLYVANVLGAASGTLVSALFLIELFGFRGTLLLTASLNVTLAIAAFLLSSSPVVAAGGGELPSPGRDESAEAPRRDGSSPARPGAFSSPIPLVLFGTGFISMAMEVVWVRQFTPFLGTVVYSFATILALYLVATFVGSAMWRRASTRETSRLAQEWPARVIVLAGLAGLIPIVMADPRMPVANTVLLAILRVALAICPFCVAVGLLTPMLVDRWSSGDPTKAGSIYALNVIGCILGPLASSFVLLPFANERVATALLALPLLVGGSLAILVSARPAPAVLRAAWAATVFSPLILVPVTRDFDTNFPQREVRRDYSATVVAAGEGMNKQLLVNGYGMTVLTPITKMMAHFPLSLRSRPPRNALVICFGMGTSFRSSLSWGIDVTAVELIPSVPALFGYFHKDASNCLASPKARVVVDDGRRFLERTRERFDVITIDPPPPVEAAGSSLLYSREFLSAARSRLAPGGILQEWLPDAEPIVVASVGRAMKETFPYVRVFRSEQGWGFHFLASDSPIAQVGPQRLAARLPAAAAADLVEWQRDTTPVEHFAAVLGQEVPLFAVVGLVPDAPALTDDRPVNEYYVVRRYLRSQPQGPPSGDAPPAH